MFSTQSTLFKISTLTKFTFFQNLFHIHQQNSSFCLTSITQGLKVLPSLLLNIAFKAHDRVALTLIRHLLVVSLFLFLSSVLRLLQVVQESRSIHLQIFQFFLRTHVPFMRVLLWFHVSCSKDSWFIPNLNPQLPALQVRLLVFTTILSTFWFHPQFAIIHWSTLFWYRDPCSNRHKDDFLFIPLYQHSKRKDFHYWLNKVSMIAVKELLSLPWQCKGTLALKFLRTLHTLTLHLK